MKIMPESQHYEMRIGEDYKYELRSADSERKQESPFIISGTGDDMYVDKADDGFEAFLSRVQMLIDRVPQAIKEKFGKGDPRIKFILSERGL